MEEKIRFPFENVNKSTKEREEKRLRMLNRNNQQFKELSLSTVKKSSVHCLPSLSSSNTFKLAKFVWIIATLTSWFYLAFQIYLSCQFYVSFRVRSSFSKIVDKQMYFPAVTICNLNPYDGNVAQDIMSWTLSNATIDDVVAGSRSLLANTEKDNILVKAVLEYLAEKRDLDLYYAGFYLSQMLFYCEFNGVACTIQDFYAYHDYNYGNCFRFNGDDPRRNDTYGRDFKNYAVKKTKKPGSESGLRLELYTGDQTSQQQYVYKTGVRVIVHNQSIIPFPDEDGIDVPVGKQTNIAISRTFIDRLPQPYSDCIDELTESVAQINEILNEMFIQKQSNQIKQYQQQYCMKLCQQSFIVSKCQCFSYELKFLNVSTFYNASLIGGCFTSTQSICADQAEVEFTNSDEIDKCYSKCPQACREQIVHLNVNQAFYPTYSYMVTIGLANAKYSVMSLNIYYESNTFASIKESPILTLNSLISNIGGNIGLFTGASVLSLFELIEFSLSSMILIMTLYFSKKKNTI